MPRLLAVSARRQGQRSDEANLPAESNSSTAGTRFPSSNEDAGWPRRPEAPSSKGSQASSGVESLEVGVVVSTGRFRPANRLLRSREFEYVLRHGRRTTAAPFIVLTAASRGTSPGQRLGITVSKRVGNAVVRNRVKRRVREWFRLTRVGLAESTDLVVIGQAGAGALSGPEIAALLDSAVAASTRPTEQDRS